jgi:hypothetical protein
MSKQQGVECDCLIRCGDDPWLSDGRSAPCARMKKQLAFERKMHRQMERAAELRKFYGVNSDFELIEKMHSEITRLEASA